MEAYPKFIIEEIENEGKCLILSKCTYHKQLARDVNNIIGGGWFHLDINNFTFTFFGNSHDFGKAELNDIFHCVKNEKIYKDKFLVQNITRMYKFRYRTINGEIIDLN